MNVDYKASLCEDIISAFADDSSYKILRRLASDMGVPSLELAACQAVTNLVKIKKPAKSIDIGCGIGVSSLAILKGYPDTELISLDGNLERLMVFNEFFKDRGNVRSYQVRGEQWLAGTDDMYDFAFIDSVKREYPSIWQKLRPRLNSGALVILDDILIYGYIAAEEAETPAKYQSNRKEILSFLEEIFSDETITAQIIPVSGGLLVISL